MRFGNAFEFIFRIQFLAGQEFFLPVILWLDFFGGQLLDFWVCLVLTDCSLRYIRGYRGSGQKCKFMNITWNIAWYFVYNMLNYSRW